MTAVRIERRAIDAAAEPLRCTVLPPRSTPTAPAVLRVIRHHQRFWTLIGAARDHRSIARGSAVSANATFAHSIRAEAVKTRDPPSIRSVAPWVPRASMSAVSSSKCSVHVMPQFSFKTCVVFMACRSPSIRQSPSRTRLPPTTGAR